MPTSVNAELAVAAGEVASERGVLLLLPSVIPFGLSCRVPPNVDWLDRLCRQPTTGFVTPGFRGKLVFRQFPQFPDEPAILENPDSAVENYPGSPQDCDLKGSHLSPI